MNLKYLNMEKKIILLSIILFCSNTFSCKKFLDVKDRSTTLVVETAADVQLLLNDYNNMNLGYPSDGLASSDDHYLSSEGYLAVNIEDQQFYIWSTNAFRASADPQWMIPYHIIYLANMAIENLEKLKGTSDQNNLNEMRGQALFFRSYSFWQLAQLYAQPFVSTSADRDLGIPLRLSSDINGKSSRGTVQDTYSRILTDLKEAVDLLATTSVVPSRPNKAAGYAMLARVYLSMNDYTQALNYANLALQLNNQLLDYNTLSKTSNTPFTRFNKEVFFNSATVTGATLVPGSATSNVAKIDPNLLGSYAANDLRRQLFFKTNSGVHSGSFRFTGNYLESTSATLFNGLAVDEIYLIRAECYARSGNISAAMLDLNTLLRTRWVTGTFVDFTALTADEALSKVLSERRKELVMRGLRWTDLRRLNLDSRFAITLQRTVSGITYTLPPNDLRYTLQIPIAVITTTGIPQNPR
jgi:tetratricopeptide (TPR) repeat protein